MYVLQSLAVGPLAAHKVSQMMCNRDKNRFANIYPCYIASIVILIDECRVICVIDDDSRVVLEEIPEFLGTDYINASWIDVKYCCRDIVSSLALCSSVYRATNIPMPTSHLKVTQDTT